MNWLVWRQHRKQIIFASAAVVVYAIVLLILGAYTAHANHTTRPNYYTFNFTGAARYMPLATIAFPVLLALFWGAPLISKEYEQHTNKFIWTQGVSRRAWLRAKLGWLMGFAAVFGAILSVACWYCLRTEHALYLDRFEWVHFDVQGAMPVVYCMFAVALGAAVGAWRRKAVSAIAMTLGIFIALQGAMGLYIRPHYQKPLQFSTTSYVRYPNPLRAPHGMVTGTSSEPYKTTSAGTPVQEGTAFWQVKWGFSPAPYCPQTQEICDDATTITTYYHPANRYWRFQAIETGIYLVLTALLVAGTYRMVLKRDA